MLLEDSDHVTGPLPSGFVTFLFTDIEGSTRLFRRLGEAYVPLLERHHDLLRSAWAAHRGVEVKTEGDAFFVAFDDADNAVAAAIEAQRALTAEAWPEDEQLRVRMGIHSGLAVPRGRDYIAFAVHQAARVVGAAHGGQILISEVTQRAVERLGPSLHPIGRFRIRDFDHPIDLYTAAAPGITPDIRTPRAVPAMGHNLAVPATSFFGRARDVADVAALLRPGALVSIVGPGGAGKTRLATEVGLMSTYDWPDGVWLVELAPLAIGMPVAGTVAEAVGIAIGSQDPMEALTDHLAGLTSLVILDNCEHVVASVADLCRELARRANSMCVVTTSREPLGLSHERVWRIRPLRPEDGGVDLFVARSRDAGLDGSLSIDDLAVIGRVCARLDGNPLAIELAAARAATVGLSALEVALDDRFRLLRSRRRDLDTRQRSMRALLDWSHDLLEPDEQVVLHRLSIFNDHFATKAAEIACVDQTLDATATMDSLWALVDKSLVVVDSSVGETRYTMSETVRDYGRSYLTPAHQTEIALRLGGWYLQRFGPWTHFDAASLSDLRLELDNIRGVLEVLADDHPASAQELAITIAYARDVSGEVAEGSVEIARYVAQLTHPSPTRAILLAALGRLRFRKGEVEWGHLLEEADALLGEVGPEPEWAFGVVTAMRALWLSAHGEIAEALELAKRMVDGDGPDVAKARGYSVLGLLRSEAGDAAGALDAHRTGLAFEEMIGGPIEIAIAHNNISVPALRLGRVAEAAHHQLQTLDLAAEAGSVVLVAFSLVTAAEIAAGRSQWERAVGIHAAAERWLDEAGVKLQGKDADTSAALLEEGRSRLGDTFGPVWESGHSMSLTDAIETARREFLAAADEA